MSHGRALALEGAVASAPVILVARFSEIESGHSVFSIRREQLTFVGLDNRRRPVKHGEFDVWSAPSPEAEGLHARFKLRS